MRLKPCPFCGSKAQPLYEEQIEITCSNIKCRMYPASFAVHVLQWNTRPTEDALRARITELKYQLGNYKAAADGTTHWCAECKMRDDKIKELEKQVIVWHKYPEEKPEKPNSFTGMWMNVLTIDECGCIWIGTCRFIGNELDMLAPQTTKYWAYLPEAPKEEK